MAKGLIVNSTPCRLSAYLHGILLLSVCVSTQMQTTLEDLFVFHATIRSVPLIYTSMVILIIARLSEP